MFRRKFLASLGVLPFGFLMKKPEKESYVTFGKEKLYIKDGYVYKRDSEYKTEYFNEKGELHSENRPAVEYDKEGHWKGDKRWYKNGKAHRENGPACEYSNGFNSWYIEGEFIKTEKI